MGLFGKSQEKNPKEMVSRYKNIRFLFISHLLTLIVLQVQEWTHKLRKEGYQLDRQVRGKICRKILKKSFEKQKI